VARFAVLAALALALAAGCAGDDEASPAAPASTAAPAETGEAEGPAAEGLPPPVAQTRAEILAAAAAEDYDALEPLIDDELFLSDAGFGEDPVAAWREQGTVPLETMTALLALRHTVEETNEGTLYRWPRFTADSDPAEMTEAERDALVALLGEDGLEAAFQPETGYIAPRLGILDDGTWWFLVMEPAP
jgi:hypothetical protein